MSKNKLIFFVAFILFLGITANSLWKELKRETTLLKSSISGVILSSSEVGGGIIKTDNAHILLFDPETLELVASKIINPFLPPLTFSIGQSDTKNPLEGYYRLLVITDKNGNINKSVPGEVIGPLSNPISLGTEGVKYTIDRPFQKLPKELYIKKNDNLGKSIRGRVKVSDDLIDQLGSSDQLVIMLFDMNLGRPVAIKMLSRFNPPQKFSIGQENVIGDNLLKGSYSLRILTDKNKQPFISVPGEIIGRSKELIPMGTMNLEFILDSHYIR